MCTHTHTHTHVYIYMCVCECVVALADIDPRKVGEPYTSHQLRDSEDEDI